ncbi:MAG: LysM peptidoglycan-binding domain-containing protein [Elusimicrobia bacterium]|nr:LysM peptidoglycan-binding domain-containing protein [Elusimicrobiota bacterium]
MKTNWRPSLKIPTMLLLFMAFSTPELYPAFEENLPGARPSAMGGAFAAIADDAHAPFVNPAGLGFIEHQEFASGYSRLYLGLWDSSNLGTGFLSYTRPLHRRRKHMGTIGAGWMNFSLVQFYSEDTFALAYGKEIWPWGLPKLYGGATLKMLKTTFKLGADPTAGANPFFKTYGTQASALGLDLGLLYRGLPGYSLAYRSANINSPDIGLKDPDPIAPIHELGFAHHRPQANIAIQLFRQLNEQSLKAGAERWVFDGRIAGRAGFIFGNRSVRQVTAGFGLRAKSFALDYSINLPLSGIESTNGSHRVSISVPFGERPKKSLTAQAEALTPEESAILTEELNKARTQLREKEVRLRQLESALERFGYTFEAGIHASTASAAFGASAAELEALKTQLKGIQELLETTRQETKAARERERAALKALEERQIKAEEQRVPAADRMHLHTVKTGDTLKSLAREYYDDESQWTKIYKANEGRLRRGGETTPGQILIIPALNEEANP